MILNDIDLHRSTNRSSSNLKVRDLDRSLFIESLDMLTDSNNEISNMLKDIHIDVALSESKNTTYLNEFSITSLITAVINGFIKIITSIFDQFKNLFNKLFKKDQVLKQYESKLKNFTGEFNLSFERYNYTIYDDSLDINIDKTFNSIYSDFIKKLKDLKKAKTSTERTYEMERLQLSLNDTLGEFHYDKIRGDVIKNISPVSKDLFPQFLFNKFRDGGAMITSKVNSIDITTIYDRYMRSDDMLKETEKLKNDTIKSAKKLEQEINGLTLDSINKSYQNGSSAEEEVMFRRIINTVTGDVNEMKDIFVQAFSAKCDAIKESVKQDRKALNEAIKYIQANENT